MTPLHPTSLHAVELPEGAEKIYITSGGMSGKAIFFYIGNRRNYYGLPPGNWQILFTTATATEQDWDAVLPKESDPLTGDEYLDFITGKYIHHLSYKSGYSLLAANGLEVEKNYAILTLKNK